MHRQEDEHESFVAFLDQRLKTALTFEEYPLADRILAAQILASKGLLRTVTPVELNLPADVFNFDAAKKLRENPEMIMALKTESAKEAHISLSELADLDPFHVRSQDIIATAGELLSPESSVSESGPVASEKIKEVFGGFLKQSYKDLWSGTPEQVAKAGEKPEIRKPEDAIWSNTVHKEPAKFGEFTMNPDTAGINWEQIPPEKIKVINPLEINPALAGKKRWEVIKYITQEWPGRHRYLFPGIEYWKYVFEHPDQAPTEMRVTSTWNYFIGSIFRGTDGDWNVPNALWNGASFVRLGDWLSDDWSAFERVVLLEK